MPLRHLISVLGFPLSGSLGVLLLTAATVAAMPSADSNRNGVVDITDLNILISPSPSSPPPPPPLRGRVKIVNGNVVTDRGTPIRGGSAGVPCDGSTVSLSGVASMSSTYGLNALRLFVNPGGVCPGYDPTMGNVPSIVDSFVDETAKDGMYLIIVIGVDGDGTKNLPAIQQFWNFYAPRYKDRTHVIYEIKNEPEYRMPYRSDVIQMEVRMWKLIRSLAPDTHIIAWSPGGFGGASDDLATLQAGASIDYSNTSVGLHAYNSDYLSGGEIASALKAAGYPLLVTEFGSYNSEADMVRFTSALENFGLGWIVLWFPANFTGIYHSFIDDHYRNLIDGAEIKWVPDFGTWPLPASP